MPDFEFTDEALNSLGEQDNPAEDEGAATPPPGEVVLDDGGSEKPAAEDTGEETPEPILGKFKTQDDLVEAYKALETKLATTRADKDEFDQLKEQFQQLQEYIQNPAPAAPTYDRGQFDRLIDEDPATAAELAYQSGDQYRVREAITAWKEMDPFSAAVWVGEKRREEELLAIRQQYDQQLGPVQQEAQSTQFNRAWAEVAGRYNDLPQFAEDILQAAQTAPEVIQGLRSGTYEDKTRVIENLYWLAKGRKADSLAEAVQEMAKERQEEDRQRKIDGAVASGSSAKVAEGKTPVEIWQERILQSPNTSIREGLTQ